MLIFQNFFSSKLLWITILLTLLFTSSSTNHGLYNKGLVFENFLSMNTLYQASIGENSAFSLDKIPQALAFTEQYLIFTLYSEAKNCSLIVIDKNSLEVLIVLRLKDKDNHDLDAHLGGIAYDFNGNIFISGTNDTIFHLSLSVIEDKIKNTSSTRNTFNLYHDEYNVITPLGGSFCSPSFLTVFDDKLYVGEFNLNNSTYLYEYKIHYNGKSIHLSGCGTDPIKIPKQIQGISFIAENKLILSQSYGRRSPSSLYFCKIIDNKLHLLSPVFDLPPLSEGVVFHDDSLYILYESSAYKYRFTAKDVQYFIQIVPLEQLLKTQYAA